MPDEHPMFMEKGDTWNSLKFNTHYDATERISEFLNDIHKISKKEITAFPYDDEGYQLFQASLFIRCHNSIKFSR